MTIQHTYVAALDLGSNSFHLAIGELDRHGVLRVTERRKESVQLAAGLDKSLKLSQERIDSAIQSIERFAQQMRYIEPKNRRIVATSTLRKARNADDFCIPAAQILQQEIDIISGLEEARLILFGVKQSIEPTNKSRIVIDIGGGSTEFAVGNQEEVTFLDSFDTGCVSLTNRHFGDGTYNKKRVDAAFYDAKLVFEGLYEHLQVGDDYQLIGTSGTLKALGRIAEAYGFSSGGKLNQESLAQIEHAWIKGGGICNIGKSVVSSRRLGVLPGGLAVIRAAMKAAKIDHMQICEYALRDGVLHELANSPEPRGVRDRTIERLQVRSGVNQAHAQSVAKTAVALLQQHGKTKFLLKEKLLDTAAKLHEIGVLISHNNHAQHGAYILTNGDLLGYDLFDQRFIGELVRQQHGRIDLAAASAQGLDEKAFLVLLSILRISIALHLGRREEKNPLSSVRLSKMKAPKSLVLALDKEWVQEHPLSVVALNSTKKEIEGSGLVLDIIEV